MWEGQKWEEIWEVQGMWEGQKWEDEGMWEGQKWEWEGAEGGNMRLLVMDAPTELSQVNLIK